MLSYIRKSLLEYVDVEEESITDATRFVADLNLNSYDIISLVGKTEQDLGVEIPDGDIRNLVTVGDLSEYLREKLQ